MSLAQVGYTAASVLNAAAATLAGWNDGPMRALGLAVLAVAFAVLAVSTAITDARVALLASERSRLHTEINLGPSRSDRLDAILDKHLGGSR